MTKPILQVRGLSRSFPIGGGRDVQAVQDLNFEVPAGQTLALVGESGCGKTTTTKMILRLDSPTHGQVLVDGQDVHGLRGSGLRDYRAKVQAVFQDPFASLSPRMRVRDIVAEPLEVQGHHSRKEIDRRVHEVLDAVGLRHDQARNYPHEFSGGQRQRIAIASALVSRPELIVLDEPVSALDVSIRSQIMNLFKDLQEEFGVSYLLVAHDLATTRYLADQVAVMYLGRIVEYGPSEQVFNDPQHPYTKALFSAALPSHPSEPDTEIMLEGEIPSPLAPPSGCAFHPRCQLRLGEVCARDRPRPEWSDTGVMLACHRGFG
ncbi:ABC transporter ATP-binding protein [Alloyangia pacifica]|uniref:ABC transporter ATP-binding protein n=1 Tax=Alloyangia pacifica TaxID=311180 RepID=UPI001CFCBA14|nr:oligopeptide/dipeptide ABC transporter ATP-binding protein [Alloyangia pacifica]